MAVRFIKDLLNSSDPLIKAVIENYRIWLKLVPWEQNKDYRKCTSRLFDMVPVYLAYGSDYLNIKRITLKITDDGRTIPDEKSNEKSCAISWSI